MNDKMMDKTVKELKRLREERDQLDAKIEAYETLIKNEMTLQDKYEFSGEGWKVTWKLSSSSRFSQSEFKESHPRLYEKFKRISESRRFNLS